MNDLTTRLIAALDAAQEHVQVLRSTQGNASSDRRIRDRIAELDANIAELRALRDELRAAPIPFVHIDTVKIVQESLRALPVGNVKTHTPESIPDRIRDLVAEMVRLSLIEEADEKRTSEAGDLWVDLAIGDIIQDGDRMLAPGEAWCIWERGPTPFNSHHPITQRRAQDFITTQRVVELFKNIASLRINIRRHGPEGYDLVDTTVPDPLSHLFQLQAALNARCGVDLSNLSDEDKAEWTLQYTRAMQQEIAELIDSVPWKWWAKYQKFDEQNAKVEVVDLFHFLISLAQVFGMSATDVYEAYLKKNAVNHARQDSGYVAKDANDSKHI